MLDSSNQLGGGATFLPFGLEQKRKERENQVHEIFQSLKWSPASFFAGGAAANFSFCMHEVSRIVLNCM
mgnify:CR=1 FL=1